MRQTSGAHRWRQGVAAHKQKQDERRTRPFENRYNVVTTTTRFARLQEVSRHLLVVDVAHVCPKSSGLWVLLVLDNSAELSQGLQADKINAQHTL